jgi:hypothetical protein
VISIITSVKDTEKYNNFLLPSIKRTDAILASMNLPKIDLVVTKGEQSIARNYNEGNSKAIFKIRAFVHEDVDIGEPNWIFKILKTFAENPDCGMIGMVGTKKLNDSGMWWESGKEHIIGEVFSGSEKADWVFDPLLFPTEAECSDGFFLAFPDETSWDESLPGFHFYDLDQARRIKSENKKILIVPHKAWHLGKIREPIPAETWKPYLSKWRLS